MLKLLIIVLKLHFLVTKNFLPDLWNTQATLGVWPGLTIQSDNFGIDKHFLQTGCVRILTLFIIFQVCKNLCAVDNEQANRLIYLRGSQAYTAAFIHGFPHVLNQFFETGIVGCYLCPTGPQNLCAISDNWKYHRRKFMFLSQKLKVESLTPSIK